jgi:two-component system, OmpR family, response regulator
MQERMASIIDGSKIDGSKRILVIDDEPNIQKIVQAALENLGGWQVMVATTVPEGLVKAETEQPDAILLDVVMPGIDGIDGVQRLKKNPKTQSIPVIFMTILAKVTERQEFLALGAAGAIAKPFDPLTLVPRIVQILNWNSE